VMGFSRLTPTIHCQNDDVLRFEVDIV